MGVAITGGLANRIAHLLADPAFEARFTAKGRYRARMLRMPVRLLTYAEPGLLGGGDRLPARASPMNRHPSEGWGPSANVGMDASFRWHDDGDAQRGAILIAPSRRTYSAFR